MSLLDVVGRGLLDAARMLWQTLWALVFGFGLSGALQAFVSRARMQTALGDHRPRTIGLAGFLGAISSSCSYAASALAKTLFVRGADFTTAQVFLFASTNLVLELGVVLWSLIGWQFAAAEFVGGLMMVSLLGVVLPRVVSPSTQEVARRRLAGAEAVDRRDSHCDGADGGIRSLAGWADAAGYTISDLVMLRRELLGGFVVAGFADTAVPVSVWKAIFVTGHGFGSVAENAVIGPFLAIISFVCSIGNVPLAAALWSGGISFAGTVAFVFADLITLPLLLIYRRYYGTRLSLRLLAVFWGTMSIAGIATQYLFKAAGILPTRDAKKRMLAGTALGLNHVTVLDLVAIVALAALYWLHRNRGRFGGDRGYATDPVCGMQIRIGEAPAGRQRDDASYWFCSDRCAEKFGDSSTPLPAGR